MKSKPLRLSTFDLHRNIVVLTSNIIVVKSTSHIARQNTSEPLWLKKWYEGGERAGRT